MMTAVLVAFFVVWGVWIYRLPPKGWRRAAPEPTEPDDGHD